MTMDIFPPPWRQPHAPERSVGRCCAVCGKPGMFDGAATTALRIAGYDIPQLTMGYAHRPCLIRARKQAVAREQALARNAKPKEF